MVVRRRTGSTCSAWSPPSAAPLIEDNKAVFDTDPKAMDTISWLFDHFKAETITYGGSLPKGQGVDALFYGEPAGHLPVGPLDPAEPARS